MQKNRYLSCVLFFILICINNLFANEQLAKELANSSAIPLYNLHKDILKQTVSSVLNKNKNIKAFIIIDNLSNEEFLNAYRKDGKLIFDKKIPELIIEKYIKTESNINYNNEIIGKIVIYYKDKEEIDLKIFTENEIAWLKKNSLIKLAVMKDSISDDSGNNIHTDFLKLLNKYGGIDLIPTWYDGWKQGFAEAVKAESVHGIMDISFSKEREEKFFHYTKPYDSKPNQLLVRDKNTDIKSLEDLKYKTVYTIQNSITNTILKKSSSDIDIIEHEDIDTMLQSFDSKNEADAILVYYISEKKLKKYNLKIIKKIYGKYSSLHIGVAHKHKDLQSIIDKIYKIIPKSELSFIQHKIYKKTASSDNQKLILNKKEKDWIIKHPVIKVGGEIDWAPFDFVDEGGTYTGLSKDYLDVISSLSGLNFEVKTGKSWNELLTSLKNGELDMLPAIYFSQKRENLVNFTTPYLSITDYYITKFDYPKISLIDSLYDKKVVSVKGYDITSWLKEKHPKISVIEVNTLLEALQSVASGETVAFINDNPSSTYLIDKHFISGLKVNNTVKNRIPISLHMATKKEYKILVNILNKAIQRISKEAKRKISNRWMSKVTESKNSLNLSQREMLWLSKKTVIKFAVDPNWLPIESINKNSGNYEGMMADILNLVSDVSGMKFELVPTKKWNESLELVKNKDVEMLAAASITPKRKEFLNFSDKTIVLSDGVIMKNDANFITSLNDLKGLRIGVSKGTSLHNMLKKDYPTLILVPTKGIENGLEKLNKDEIDSFIGNLEVASHIIFKKHLFNLKVILKLESSRDLHIGLIKSMPIEARSIINKALKRITKEEFDTIRQRWIGLKINEEIDYTIFYKIALGVIILILFFVYWNRKLQQLVSKRTADLQEQKDKLALFNKNLESLVSQRTIALEDAKKEVEEIHQLTRDSIEYAALIQNALIPEKSSFDIYFDDHLSLWSPKDIVGGDIYLFEELRGKHECLLMVIDCTGHGVPGAFVTMLVKAIERQVVSKIVNNEDLEVSPAWILSYFNKNMKRLLSQDNEDSISNVGFDGGILYYNKKDGVIKYAGAETPLFYFQDSELKVIKSDRHSVGYKKSDVNYEFKEHVIDIKDGMQFYISTDGYLDQNGGEKSFPFGKKRFQEIIKSTYTKSFEDQKNELVKTMQSYQGAENRNDDITVIGLKI